MYNRRIICWGTMGLLLSLAVSAAEAGVFQRASQPSLRPPLNAPDQIIPEPLFTPPPVDDLPQLDAPDSPPPPPYRAGSPVIMPQGMPLADEGYVVVDGEKVCVKYRHFGRRVVRDCQPVVTQMLCAVNPCTGCQIEVPVCLPVCCDDCPKVHGRRAVFSQSLVSYEWCCGVKVVIRFERCGAVTVTYHGV